MSEKAHERNRCVSLQQHEEFKGDLRLRDELRCDRMLKSREALMCDFRPFGRGEVQKT